MNEKSTYYYNNNTAKYIMMTKKQQQHKTATNIIEKQNKNCIYLMQGEISSFF